MKVNIKTILFFTFFFLMQAAWCSAEDFIDITKFSLRKIPIAIPLVKVTPGVQNDISLKAADMLSNDLNFTGYFKILDRKAFLSEPDPEGVSINFKNWTGIGAELLITGNALVQKDIVEMELRLFDTFKGHLLIGKRYKGWQKDMQKIIRKFCNEVIHHLTGQWGIFDSQIAFISSGTGNKEIYTCDFDGKSIKRLTTHNSITLSPAWSHDGGWMAYTSYAKGRPDLYIKNIAQKHGAVVAKKGINTTPAWMPNKFMLAATLSFSGDQDIYLLTGQGKIVKQLTKKWGIDTSPAWSPDGRKIAFVSNRAGNPQIYIKDINSGRVDRLTFEGKYNTQPDWSPRGDKIVYSSVERGEINIHVADIQSKSSARLTYNSQKNESPSWSPDGSLIVFSSTREGGASRIYVMTSYGTDQRRLLGLAGEQFSPKWSPRIKSD